MPLSPRRSAALPVGAPPAELLDLGNVRVVLAVDAGPRLRRAVRGGRLLRYLRLSRDLALLP